MPYPNEHAARLVDPAKIKPDSFRRSTGGTVQGVELPDTIDVIWGELKDGDNYVPQSLRFPTENWTEEKVRNYLEEHDINIIIFEPAAEGDAMRKDNKTELQVRTASFAVREYSADEPLPIQLAEPKDPERVIRFVASDDTVDHYNEVILPDGWDLSLYSTNPVVMQFHDYQMWPIGQSVALGVVDNKLMIDSEFDPPEIDPEADKVFRKIKHGTIRAGSVGFLPTEIATNPAENKDLWERYPGVDLIYTKSKLLEWTICPIPANPSALAAAMRGEPQNKNTNDLGDDSTSTATTESLPPSVARRIDEIIHNIRGDSK